MTLLDYNLQYLKNVHKEIYDLIMKINHNGIMASSTTVEKAKNGDLTLKYYDGSNFYYIHSNYNPRKEAEKFIAQNIVNNIEYYIVFGFGLGYHVVELLKYEFVKNVFIFEFNNEIFLNALKSIKIASILEDDRVRFFLIESIEFFNRCLQNILNSIPIDNYKIIYHEPLIKSIPPKMKKIKDLLLEFKILDSAFNNNENYYILKDNFENNILTYDKPINELFNCYRNVPAIIIAAGPSLEENIERIRKLRSDVIIIVVSRVSKYLLQNRIIPDYIVVSDPFPIVQEHLTNISSKVNIPLIALSTAYKGVINEWSSTKYLAFQKNFNLAEEYAKGNSLETLEVGGSVSTLAVEVAIKFGCNPIIFVGLDLAFTGNKVHAFEGSVIHDYNYLIETTNYLGEKIYTNHSLNIFKRWIERKIENNKHITFINTSRLLNKKYYQQYIK
ncbi:DUF115 domain-containing protein [Caldicellulosiruptor changbaiensis]|uniref:DUF115 domain-containing protein n=1 Tax=Caldicellulosiruptor changbaiensis TaxID=1222016 RepID=A0A3T0D9I6_9FIRM|nr:6-hydroxymethylpterin diphosphokinase MptE-like protein [Caldicellulosiruptor changbaiensis]AZT91658.1 DUF115 domain-containing protein [Caldicellulosiruptor changbaiensis]